jgi:hypothetical protein
MTLQWVQMHKRDSKLGWGKVSLLRDLNITLPTHINAVSSFTGTQVPFNIRFLSDMYEYTVMESTTTINVNKGFRLGYIQKSSPCIVASPLATQPILTPDGLSGTTGR